MPPLFEVGGKRLSIGIPDELLRLSKRIPVKILKDETGMKGDRAELTKVFYQRDPERFASMADLYDALKSRFSGYVFRIPRRTKINVYEPHAALTTINSYLNESWDREEGRIRVLKASSQGREVTLHIKYESDSHIDRLWEGEAHTHKKVRQSTVSLRFDLGCATFRGRSKKKALACMEKLSAAIFDDPSRVQLVVTQPDDGKNRFGDIRSKKAVVEDVKIPGTKRLTLTGENVERSIDVLKDTYGLDFLATGSKIRFEKTETSEQVKIEADGRIVIPSRFSDRDEILKRLVK